MVRQVGQEHAAAAKCVREGEVAQLPAVTAREEAPVEAAAAVVVAAGVGGGGCCRLAKESSSALSVNSKATYSSSQASMAGSLALRLYASRGPGGRRSPRSPALAPGRDAPRRPATHTHARTHTHTHTHTSLEILFLPHRNVNQIIFRAKLPPDVPVS